MGLPLKVAVALNYPKDKAVPKVMGDAGAHAKSNVALFITNWPFAVPMKFVSSIVATTVYVPAVLGADALPL